MTSKKHWTLRAAGLLFALVLITSCFVGGTFAKYVTTGSGHESARVAKFGVTMSVATDTAFKQKYTTGGTTIPGPGSINYSVEYSGNGNENLVAPGTKGSNFVVLSIKGTPEVAVNVKIAATGYDVVLNKGTYPDLTTAAANQTFTLENDYHPITYTLTKTGEKAPVETGNLDAIIDYLNNLNQHSGNPSGNYKANTDLSQVFGTYTLSWEWKFEDGNDKADTLLGAITAGGMTPSIPVTYVTGVYLPLDATVTQID